MLYVFDWNIAAIKCYEKAGFVTDKGVTKRREANGKIWTAIKMLIDKKQN
jgi:RimJ/RimL family protein N-acetyltransferase